MPHSGTPAWKLYGSCLEAIWKLFGSCSEARSPQALQQGSCSEAVWNLFGSCLEPRPAQVLQQESCLEAVWKLFGSCLEARPFQGSCLEAAWNLFGSCFGDRLDETASEGCPQRPSSGESLPAGTIRGGSSVCWRLAADLNELPNGLQKPFGSCLEAVLKLAPKRQCPVEPPGKLLALLANWP